MRVFAICVIAVLGGSVVADTCSLSRPAYPRIVLPNNATAAEYFDAAVSAFTETVRYGIKDVVILFYLPKYWSFKNIEYDDNRVVTRGFDETLEAIVHFNDLLVNFTRNGIKKLQEEVNDIDVDRFDRDFRSGQSFIMKFLNSTRKGYSMHMKYYQLTTTYADYQNRQFLHLMEHIGDTIPRYSFKDLYQFNKVYKDTFLMWHTALKTYRTSNSPAVMWFESYYNDEEFALRMTNVRIGEISAFF